jgi:hypothetical protein
MITTDRFDVEKEENEKEETNETKRLSPQATATWLVSIKFTPE